VRAIAIADEKRARERENRETARVIERTVHSLERERESRSWSGRKRTTD